MLLHRLSAQPQSTRVRPRQNLDRDSRAARATDVTAMQANVSRIQQDILALSNATNGQAGSEQDGAEAGQMAALNRELEMAQRELAKIQGRI